MQSIVQEEVCASEVGSEIEMLCRWRRAPVYKPLRLNAVAMGVFASAKRHVSAFDRELFRFTDHNIYLNMLVVDFEHPECAQGSTELFQSTKCGGWCLNTHSRNLVFLLQTWTQTNFSLNLPWRHQHRHQSSHDIVNTFVTLPNAVCLNLLCFASVPCDRMVDMNDILKTFVDAGVPCGADSAQCKSQRRSNSGRCCQAAHD